MNRFVLVAVAWVAGCYRPAAFEDPCAITCTPAIGCPDGLTCVNGRCGNKCDLEIDSGIAGDVVPATCYGNDLVQFCPEAGAIATGVLSLGADVDVDDVCPLTITQPNGKPLCVFAAESIHVTQRARLHGTAPVLLFATRDITIDPVGQLDLSQGGAGSHPGECTSDVAPSGSADGTPAGGGAGGSFAFAGGAGGASGNAKQVADAPATISYVRGGCDGHRGGSTANGAAGGNGGRGGGGIWLMALLSIDISGRVHVNGFGGAGATVSTAGGGGGGSGGLVGLEAPVVIVRSGAFVVANGGGGGGGAFSSAGTMGGGGRFDSTPAPGGTGGGSNIDGGPGWPGVMSSLDGQGTGTAGTGGGGGGGGGAGEIRIIITNTGELAGTILPMPVMLTPP